MAESRKADIFAGEGSLAGTLRKRRQAIEAGDATGGMAPEQETPKRDQSPKSSNEPRHVVKRGYFVDDGEE